MDPRRVPEGTEVSYTTTDGQTRSVRAKQHKEGYHYIEPRDAAEVAVLTSLGYPTARQVMESQPIRPASRRGSRSSRSSRRVTAADTAAETTTAPAPEPAGETVSDTTGPGAAKGDQ